MVLNPVLTGWIIRGFEPGATISKTIFNRHHIMHVHFTSCFTQVPARICQKFAILTISQRSIGLLNKIILHKILNKIQSSKDSCKMLFLLHVFRLKWTSNTP